MIHHLDSVTDPRAADLHEFSLRVLSVVTHGDDHGDLRIRYPGLVEVIDQQTQGARILLPGTGDVAHRNGHRVVGFDDLLQRRCIDGVIEGVEVCGRRIGQRGMIIPNHFVKEMLFGDLELYRSFTKTEREFLHHHGWAPLYL